MVSLARTLEVIADHLDPELVPPPQRSSLLEAAAWLPAALSEWFYLEIRLAERADQVDLIVRVGDHGRALLAGSSPAAAPAPPPWARIAEFYRRWSEPDSVWHRSIRCSWLEFDVLSGPETGSGPPPPGIFVDLENPTRDAHLIDATLAALYDGPLPRGLLPAIDDCRAALPPEGFVPYVGYLPHRDPSRVRLCVAGLRSESLLPFLARLGWNATSTVEGCIERIRAHRHGVRAPDPLVLHLDVGELGAEGRIGLEYVCARADQLRHGIAEVGFLQLLVDQRLASPRKVAALGSWPGVSREHLPHEVWESLVGRRLNHVKLVLTPESVVEAKAYLSVNAVPRRARRTRSRPGSGDRADTPGA